MAESKYVVLLIFIELKDFFIFFKIRLSFVVVSVCFDLCLKVGEHLRQQMPEENQKQGCVPAARSHFKHYQCLFLPQDREQSRHLLYG